MIFVLSVRIFIIGINSDKQLFFTSVVVCG